MKHEKKPTKHHTRLQHCKHDLTIYTCKLCNPITVHLLGASTDSQGTVTSPIRLPSMCHIATQYAEWYDSYELWFVKRHLPPASSLQQPIPQQADHLLNLAVHGLVAGSMWLQHSQRVGQSHIQ